MDMIPIIITPDGLDNVKHQYPSQFSHFTIGKGKAVYHFFYLANRSCGIYYAVRIGKDGYAETRRAVEPTDKITCWLNPEKI